MRLGIDFGTCYSSAALLLDGVLHPVKEPLKPQESGFASSVCLTKKGDIVISHAAENLRRSNPKGYVNHFKRDLDTDIPYFLGEQKLQYLPEDLVAIMLAGLKKEAEKIINSSLDSAVITVPATYLMNKKKLMEKAAKEAGFTEVSLLEEPVAAAIYYSQKGTMGHQVNDGDILLVYDLGGGTFDAALIQKKANSYELLSQPVGDKQCGGIYFDSLIGKDFIKSLNGSPEAELFDRHREDSHALRAKSNLQDWCRNFKHQLSVLDEYEDFPLLSSDSYILSRDKFEEMISSFIDRSCDLCEQLLQQSGIEWDSINRVLLVGGSCRIPYVQKRLEEQFQRPVVQVDDPELAICFGAAIYGVDLEEIRRTDKDEINHKEEFQQHKHEVLELFDRAIAIAKQHKSSRILKHLLEEQKHLAEGKLYVVVCGEFKQGKSSLLNAFLNETGLFPVDIDITTNLVSTITYGQKEKIKVVLGELGKETVKQIQRNEIPDYVTEQQNAKNKKQARMLVIESPNPQLKEGLVLVDTPGIGSLNTEHTSLTYAFIPNADAIIFVTDALKPLTTEELSFLKEKILPHCQNLIFVVTKVDTVSDGQQIVSNNREKLAQVLDCASEKITMIPVSSRAKLDYLKYEEPEDLEYSNFPELEERVWQLVDARGQAFLLRAVNKLAQSVGEMKVLLKITWETHLEQDKKELDALENRLKETQSKLRNLLDQNAGWFTFLINAEPEPSNEDRQYLLYLEENFSCLLKNICSMIKKGYFDREIAEEVFVSPRTITRIRRIVKDEGEIEDYESDNIEFLDEAKAYENDSFAHKGWWGKIFG